MTTPTLTRTEMIDAMVDQMITRQRMARRDCGMPEYAGVHPLSERDRKTWNGQTADAREE